MRQVRLLSKPLKVERDSAGYLIMDTIHPCTSTKVNGVEYWAEYEVADGKYDAESAQIACLLIAQEVA